jgi:hypothetical protein
MRRRHGVHRRGHARRGHHSLSQAQLEFMQGTMSGSRGFGDSLVGRELEELGLMSRGRGGFHLTTAGRTEMESRRRKGRLGSTGHARGGFRQWEEAVWNALEHMPGSVSAQDGRGLRKFFERGLSPRETAKLISMPPRDT